MHGIVWLVRGSLSINGSLKSVSAIHPVRSKRMSEQSPEQGNGRRVGFIGLGVMGAPMCRHIAQKAVSAEITSVTALDVNGDAARALGVLGVVAVDSVPALVAQSDMIHLCLPGGAQLEDVCRGPGHLMACVRPGQAVVDHGTSPAPLTRALAAEFAELGVAFADAPVTRTRDAAEAGTLVTLFGGDEPLLERVTPTLSAFSAEIVHCGDVGAGQVFKQLNNMVLFQNVVALSEALATARRAGVDDAKLFHALSQGSADSFALRNHGMKSLLPGVFPERAFSAAYALKDLTYAIELAEAHGLELVQADATRRRLEAAISAGYADDYFPTVLKAVDDTTSSAPRSTGGNRA